MEIEPDRTAHPTVSGREPLKHLSESYQYLYNETNKISEKEKQVYFFSPEDALLARFSGLTPCAYGILLAGLRPVLCHGPASSKDDI